MIKHTYILEILQKGQSNIAASIAVNCQSSQYVSKLSNFCCVFLNPNSKKCKLECVLCVQNNKKLGVQNNKICVASSHGLFDIVESGLYGRYMYVPIRIFQHTKS